MWFSKRMVLLVAGCLAKLSAPQRNLFTEQFPLAHFCLKHDSPLLLKNGLHRASEIPRHEHPSVSCLVSAPPLRTPALPVYVLHSLWLQIGSAPWCWSSASTAAGRKAKINLCAAGRGWEMVGPWQEDGNPSLLFSHYTRHCTWHLPCITSGQPTCHLAWKHALPETHIAHGVAVAMVIPDHR